MKKKLLSFVLVICLILPLSFVFTACKEPENEPPKAEAQSKMMVLSLNPSIELILDSNDKVVSVNATTQEGDIAEEGNLIIAQAEFVGKTAEEAVDLYLEVLEDNGYIVSGQAMGQNFTIQVSGEDAQALYNKVRTQAESFLSEANITLNIAFEKISKEEVQKLVADCMREYSSYLELNGLTEKQLLEMLKESREETKDLETEELKELYYQARAFEILYAQIDAVKTMLTTYIPDEEERTELLSNIDSFGEGLTQMYTNFKNFYLKSGEQYQIALNEYINAKQALLEAQKYGQTEEGNNLEDAQQAFIMATNELTNAKSNADDLYDNAVKTLKSLTESIKLAYQGFSMLIPSGITETAVEQALESFKTKFASDIATDENNGYWENLKPEEF